MPQHSAVARLQQCTTGVLAALALAWLAANWQRAPLAGIAGALAIALAHSALLALQFLLMFFVGRGEPVPPKLRELPRAWLAEVWHALRVFGWRQPFRWRAMADDLTPRDAGRVGIVFIHGFVCNRGFWTPWLQQAQALGHPYAAVNLEPVFGSIDDYAPVIEQAVERITRATGRPPLLVCHSMGGLAARAWLRRHQAWDRVAHVVTIGSPHGGTWLARFSHLRNGRQMRLQGEWVTELAARPAARAGLFTCWYSSCDNIVFPASTATLPGADNRLVPGVAHVELAFRPEVMRASFAVAAAL